MIINSIVNVLFFFCSLLQHHEVCIVNEPNLEGNPEFLYVYIHVLTSILL